MAASERVRQGARRATWRVLPWGHRAREAARRAQRLARQGAIRAQRAVGQQAAKFRRAGRMAAVEVIRLQKMAKLPAFLMERSATSVLAREKGPLPDPAWVAGYRDVARAELPGMFPKPAPEPVAAPERPQEPVAAPAAPREPEVWQAAFEEPQDTPEPAEEPDSEWARHEIPEPPPDPPDPLDDWAHKPEVYEATERTGWAAADPSEPEAELEGA